MNANEKDRIAAAIGQLRPDWPTASIRTLLDRPALTDRPRRDVAVALAWVACESTTATPARVLEAGPWWQAAAIDGAISSREPFDPATTCGTCGQPEHRCRRNPNAGHDFESVVTSIRNSRKATS